MALRNPDTSIDFLLTAIDCVEGKVDWEQVAVTTEWYKSGKQARQAYNNIKKKYGGMYVGNEGDIAPKKRANATAQVSDEPAAKKAKKGKTVVEKEVADDEDDDGEDEPAAKKTKKGKGKAKATKTESVDATGAHATGEGYKMYRGLYEALQ